MDSIPSRNVGEAMLPVTSCYRNWDKLWWCGSWLMYRVDLCSYVQTDFVLDLLQSLEAPRRVYHYWYTAWPDHGVPDSPRQFLRLVEEVHIAQDRDDVKEGPVVVHCRLVVNVIWRMCAEVT